MNHSILTPEKDPMGSAIADYYKNKKASRLRVFSSQFDEDEIPVPLLFRSYDEMSELEQKALQLAKGRILDCGAGSGCHSLALQNMNKDVMAIDISLLSAQVMQERGVRNVCAVNLFDENFQGKFDTILMLMNGSGIIGKLDNMPLFFEKMRLLLNMEGCIYLDSSDLRYLFEDEDGSFLIDLSDNYYGEIDYQMQYKQVKGDIFNWLYIDFQTLSYYASQSGFTAEMVLEGNHYDYLACLKMTK